MPLPLESRHGPATIEFPGLAACSSREGYPVRENSFEKYIHYRPPTAFQSGHENDRTTLHHQLLSGRPGGAFFTVGFVLIHLSHDFPMEDV